MAAVPPIGTLSKYHLEDISTFLGIPKYGTLQVKLTRIMTHLRDNVIPRPVLGTILTQLVRRQDIITFIGKRLPERPVQFQVLEGDVSPASLSSINSNFFLL